MQLKHIFLGFFCACLWGLNFPLMKMIALEIPPLFSAALRLSLIGLCVFFVKKPKGEWLKILLLSVTLFSFSLGASTVAIVDVDASIAALLNELEIFFAAVLAYVLLGEDIERKQKWGMFLAFVGVALVVKSPEISSNNLMPIFLLTLAAFSYGFSAVLIKFIRKTKALSLTVWSAFFASIQLFILSFFFESNQISLLEVVSNHIILAIIFSSAFNLFALYLWNYLLQTYKVNQVVPFGMLLPVFSLIFAYYLLDETTHVLALFGGGLTLLGVWFQSSKSKKKT